MLIIFKLYNKRMERIGEIIDGWIVEKRVSVQLSNRVVAQKCQEQGNNGVNKITQ